MTTSYVLLEVTALLQKRLGLPWVERFQARAKPFLEIVWVDEELHDLAVEAAVSAGRRKVSIVDHLSFEVIRRRDIKYVLAFDRHFDEAGYALPPLDEPHDKQDNPS